VSSPSGGVEIDVDKTVQKASLIEPSETIESCVSLSRFSN
jgi:hypothetical protein